MDLLESDLKVSQWRSTSNQNLHTFLEREIQIKAHADY